MWSHLFVRLLCLVLKNMQSFFFLFVK